MEAAYNILPITNKQRLDAFVRYEQYDTHKSVAGNLAKNLAYYREEWTTGLSYHMSIGTVFKVDYQSKSTGLADSQYGQFNVGVGVWFNLFKINLNKLGGLKFVKYLCNVEFDYVENKHIHLSDFILFPP